MIKVMLDAGHGLYVSGKETPHHESLHGRLGNYIKEAEQNYPIMMRVGDSLIRHGIEVYYTNINITTDVSLTDRVALENSIKPDVFISIHKNAGPMFEFNDIRGTETYCYKFGANGERLARFIHKHVIELSGDKDRGVKEGNFKVIRDTVAPAVLCELGFMTNLEDAHDMLDETAQSQYADGIVRGVLDYFNIQYEELPEEDCVTEACKDNMLVLIESMDANIKSMKSLIKSL